MLYFSKRFKFRMTSLWRATLFGICATLLLTALPASAAIDSSSFAAKVDFLPGNTPYAVGIGDLDGDGKLDLAVPNAASNTVSVFRNTSASGSITSGSFAAKVDFSTGSGPNNVEIGDLDGDGKLDLVVANYANNTVSVFRNTSSGSGSIAFATKVDFATRTNPIGIAIGDLDGDGKLDFAVSNDTSGGVSVYHNTSTSGSITSTSFAAKVDFATGVRPLQIAISNLDGDGKLDLVVANLGSNSVSVYRNTSTSGTITSASFAAKVDFATGAQPVVVAINDIDQDGKPDMAVANYASNSVSVLRNTSTSGSITSTSFAAKVDFATGANPYGVAIGDFDGDGKLEIVTANYSSNSISVLRNTSTSGSITSTSFAAKVDFTTGAKPLKVGIGDFDGDGKLDLAVANSNGAAGGGTGGSVAVFRNTLVAPEIDVRGNSISIVSGDTTPSPTDHTDFGSVNVSSGTVVRTFTIQNTGNAALSVSAPTLSGANASDFSITSAPASSVAANGSTTFQITFDPSAAGTRTATISIGNNDSNENPYTFVIQGTGDQPSLDADNDGIADASDNCPAVANADQLNSDNDAQGNACDTDDDNDGVADVNDAFPLNAAESVDTDGDGIGNNADTDDDGDSVADVNDAFPLNAAESVDTDGDGIGNNADTDDDGDSVADVNDDFPLNAAESLDTDGDGTGNNADTDDDADGVADANDAFPLNAAESVDTDCDGTGNNADTDDDNDGVADANDAFPLNASESVDTDGDGIGNNADTDDDDDGVADVNDAFPLNPAESVDTDGDGTGNNADTDDDNDGVADGNDAFPLNAAESIDSDDDGTGNNADTDDDNDGVADGNDAFPLDVAESLDTDGDGIGNNADTDDDNDSILDVNDAFPLNPNETADNDGDGIGNNTDPDDDNDGVLDVNDAFPLNASESVDSDHDGVGDNGDPDDDNDGVNDDNDAFPLNASESLDTDSDGIGNNADTDDDGDGVLDANDAFPLNPNESLDSDRDGIGNNADPDNDNDGVNDSADAFPLDPTESLDSDHDGTGNNADSDDDNDGVADANDAFPLNPAESLDTDGDGIGNNADSDDDGDGVPDAQDPFPTTRDTIPPVITLAAGPITLWPPNHQYVTIPIANLVLSATDATDSQVSRNRVEITKVTSDEVENAVDDGDGNTLNDMVIAADGKAVDLRAERQGGGNGRVYTIQVQVSDRGGNTTTATFKVQVPKSQGKSQAVDDGPVYTVTRPASSVAAASMDSGSLTNWVFLPVIER